MSPVITLSNGLRVANMSSPHPFNFTTGEVLPACSPEEANRLKLESVEVETPGIKGTIDISLRWRLSPAVAEHLAALEADPGVDVVLVPFPVMTALKEAGCPIGKCRVIRSADRVTKAIYPDRFCA